MEDASDNEAAAADVPALGMVPRAVPTFEGTGWRPSDLAFRPEFHISQRPRAGLVVWSPFDDAPTPVSAMRAYYLSGWRVLLPGLYRHMWYLGERVSLQHSTRGRLVPKNPPETMLAKIEDVAQLYSDAMEAGDESICLPWENFVDRRGASGESASLDACVNLNKKLTGRGGEERRRGRKDSVDRGSPVGTLREQAGQSLGLGPGPSTGARQRHSDVDRGVVPFTYAEPTRHSVGGMGSPMPFTPPPGAYFGASSSQPWSAESWAYWYKAERMH
ncbi:hypothetical protein SOVF_111700 [Spinacia oleracea]|nr:hypothetical protein SOVF_111700 [Spinacia oleracea]